MPPTSRTRQYGGNNLGIALGEMLHKIFGGIEANPDAGLQGPTPNGQALGGDPYRPRTIFDRAAAAEANADYRTGQLEANTGRERELSFHRDLLPIKQQEKQQATEIETGAYKEKGGFDHILQKLISDHQAGNNVLQSNNIMPNALSKFDYQDKANPKQLEALLSKLGAEIATSGATVADTERDQLVKGATFADNLSTAQTQAKGGSDQIAAAREFLRLQREQALKGGEAEMTSSRFKNVGNSLVDLHSDPVRPVYTAPTDADAFKSLLPGSQLANPNPTNAQTPVAPMAKPEMIEIEVDGVRVRIPKEMAARLGR